MRNSHRDRTYREAEIQVAKQIALVKEVIFDMSKESSQSTSVTSSDETTSSPSTD